MAENEKNEKNTQEKKVPIKERVKAKLDKERTITWSWGKIIKTVAIAAAVPIAFVTGKALSDRRNEALLEGETSEPQLPMDENYERYDGDNVVELPAEEVQVEEF